MIERDVDFRVDGGTVVKTLHEGIPAAQVYEGHKIGWNGSFDRLGRRYGGGRNLTTHNISNRKNTIR